MIRKYIEAGRIVAAHGLRGEVKAEVWTGSPETLKKIKNLYLGERRLRVLSSRTQGNFLLIKFEGTDCAEAAEELKGRVFCIDREDARLPDGSCFISEIIGARVFTDSGAELGVLEDVLEEPSSCVFVVRGETEHLIPALPQFIAGIDAEAGILRVRLIEGM